MNLTYLKEAIETATGKKKFVYEKLSPEPELPPSEPQSKWHLSKILSILSAAILTAGATIVLGLFIFHKHSSLNYTDCGQSADEARIRGCFYEPMQRAWIPPECYFPEPVDEYNVFRDRYWYQDTNLTIPSNVDRLESGDEWLAYTRYWHDEHCVYVLRKLALAVDMKKPMINSRAVNIKHSNHCAHAIAKRITSSYNASFLETDDTITESILAFEKCMPLDWK